MATQDDTPIRVHETWNGWRYAEVRVSDLRAVHWLQPPGAPHHLLHAFISCASIRPGAIAHQCDRSSAPHQLRVCVLKRHATPGIYAALAADATHRPPLAVDSEVVQRLRDLRKNLSRHAHV